MSDRITKVMGYAITDLKTKNGEIIDPRINLESPFANGNYGKKGIARLTGEDYFKWLESNYQDSKEKSTHYLGNDYYYMANSDRGVETKLEDSIIFNSDLGLSKVFMITPVSMQKEWYRHDDAIDFEEYFIAHKRETFDMQAYIKPITSGNIFPYSGWINAKTKENIKHDDLGIYKYMLSEKVDPERLNSMAQAMGFANKEEVDQYLKPSPPEDLITFLEFGNLLTSPEYVYDFKPAIYTYWA
jgi:hypothetical protein